MEVSLSDLEILKCKTFAEKVVKETYDRFNKNINERKKRIFFGKLGEIGFINFLKEKNIIINSKNIFDVYPGETNVDEFDFTTCDGKKIDIKTAYNIFHKRIIVPWDQFENGKAKDFYIGIKLNYLKKKAHICGYTTKDQLLKNGKKNFGEGFGYWEFLDKLKSINNLLKMI